MRISRRRLRRRSAAIAAAVTLCSAAATHPAHANLIINIRATGGSSGVFVNSPTDVRVGGVSQTVNFDVWATVSGSNGVHDETVTAAVGSFHTIGTLLANLSGAVISPFNATGSSSGSMQDWDSDGDLDIGSIGSGSGPGKFTALASSPVTPGTIVDSNTSEARIGQLSVTINSASGSNDLTFVPAGGGNAAGWSEDGATKDPNTATFTAGSSVHVAIGLPAMYWDSNGTTAGAGSAPGGTWGVSQFWGTSSAGTGPTGGWFGDGGTSAVFAAGNDATGNYTVALSGPQTAAGLAFEEGTVTLTDGQANLVTGKINVQGSANAFINSVISGANGLTKSGPGNLTLTGASANTYSGLTTVSEGVLGLAKTTPNVAVPSNVSVGDGTGIASLVLGANEQIPNTANVNVFNAEFNLNSFNETIGSLSMSGGTVSGHGGTLTLNSGGLSTFSTHSEIDGAINLGGGNRAFNIFNSLDAVDAAVFGTISNGSLTKTGAGTLQLAGIFTYTGSTTVNGGALILSDSLTSSSSITVALSGASVVLSAAGGTHVIKTGALSVAGKLDLSDNKLITTTAIGTLGTGNTYTGVTGLVQSGRNGGNWSGTGIVTSQSNATQSILTSIGVATAQQVKNLSSATATTTWSGQTVTGSDTLVMYTYGGDANLDGKIDISDYGRIDFNIPLHTSGWYNGDFNYDGKIDISDYGIIDFNIGIQGTQFPTSFAASPGVVSGVSLVPEPALAWVACASLLAVRRRRQELIQQQ